MPTVLSDKTSYRINRFPAGTLTTAQRVFGGDNNRIAIVVVNLNGGDLFWGPAFGNTQFDFPFRSQVSETFQMLRKDYGGVLAGEWYFFDLTGIVDCVITEFYRI